MKLRHLIILVSASALIISCSSSSGPKPKTVSNFEPLRYAGEWHEIARLPNRFEKDVIAAKATYGLNKDGTLSVRNDGLKSDGERTSITGTATPVGDVTNGKLKVRFYRFPANLFAGDYWVFYVNPGYTKAIVGSPDRKTLWLLSKNPADKRADFDSVLPVATSQGFQTAELFENPKRLN